MSELSGDSGGTAHGLTAFVDAADKNTIPALKKAMVTVAEWILANAGTFLGHVKMAVTTGTKTMTLNLTDLRTGVEQHGTLIDGELVNIRFMAAVLDVDRNELAIQMNDALVANGIKIKDKKIIDLR
jgi:hypothetical protein